MATRKNTTKSFRRFSPVDLGDGRVYTPIRTEIGDMEYELAYCGGIVGVSFSVSEAVAALDAIHYDALTDGTYYDMIGAGMLGDADLTVLPDSLPAF